MRSKDWVSWIPGMFMKMTEQDHKEIEDLETTIQRFMLTMTKREIYAQGLKRRIFLAPVANVADVASDEQLKARDFWTAVPHDTIGRTLTFPGPFAKLSATPIGSTTRAPRIGEHSDEIYRTILGLTPERLNKLRAAGSI
jgi:crotonobetainyl-CoA:carnitine CoA-transferase CaiB-like acyl-CoA transferase